jgi:hypothetical protein
VCCEWTEELILVVSGVKWSGEWGEEEKERAAVGEMSSGGGEGDVLVCGFLLCGTCFYD